MRAQFSSLGLAYFVLVANFYYQSNGFHDHFTFSYSFWKVTPIVLLVAFAYLNGGGLGKSDRQTAALGLLSGGIGDFVIGLHQDGIILGALAFGIGHLYYLSLFRHHETKIHHKFLLGMLGWAVIITQLCLLPLLPEHKGPVAVFACYSMLLSTCTFIAVSQYLNGSKAQNDEGLYFRAIGFILFYISDSILIMSHTGVWKLASSFCVLSTYYTAQYFIMYGNMAAVVKKSSPTSSLKTTSSLKKIH
uniref:lysoplasmalogenase n=1 Tax=Caenorhabditis japonica TaxID=281687 RepID=A0A8R1I694_CAEJA